MWSCISRRLAGRLVSKPISPTLSGVTARPPVLLSQSPRLYHQPTASCASEPMKIFRKTRLTTRPATAITAAAPLPSRHHSTLFTTLTRPYSTLLSTIRAHGSEKIRDLDHMIVSWGDCPWTGSKDPSAMTEREKEMRQLERTTRRAIAAVSVGAGLVVAAISGGTVAGRALVGTVLIPASLVAGCCLADRWRGVLIGCYLLLHLAMLFFLLLILFGSASLALSALQRTLGSRQR